jgi:hypothetical protein
MAEDGVIPERYPLVPLPKGGYRQRTRLNVSDSDGTAILFNGSLKGGTRLTRNLCALLKRPYISINAAEMPDSMVAAGAILKFIDDKGGNDQRAIEKANADISNAGIESMRAAFSTAS